jgi:hypothetical protein
MRTANDCRSPSRRAYLGALHGRIRGFARRALGISKKPLSPVLTQPMEHVLERHKWICSLIQEHLPDSHLWSGRKVCEAGAGDCLAAASMLLGLGASHVTIVEHEPPVTGSRQFDVLEHLRALGYPCDKSILNDNNQLNKSKCSFFTCYMENFAGSGDCSLVYSICVGEHVEDLTAFFRSCYDTLVGGGDMVHYIDLGGHGIFEDPVPPLEFHRYGKIAYGAIFPRYSRATRRFVSDYIKAASDSGFINIQVKAVRQADADYVKDIVPYLKSHATGTPEEELGIIEFILYAQRPLR